MSFVKKDAVSFDEWGFVPLRALSRRELCETEKTVPNQRFGTVFLLFLGFFGGAEGLQALLDEVGDGAAADAAVKVVALEVEIRGVVVFIADGLDDSGEFDKAQIKQELLGKA